MEPALKRTFVESFWLKTKSENPIIINKNEYALILIIIPLMEI
jgi:hypothetical protein